MRARHYAALTAAAFLVLLFLTGFGIYLSADCHAASLFPRFYIALAGGIVVGMVFTLVELRGQKPFPAKKRMPVEQFVCFGLVGFLAAWMWATALPRITSNRVLTSQASYVRVPGFKSCRYAIEFDDPGRAGTIRTCASRWGLYPVPERGTVSVTEKVSGLGVYLMNVKFSPS
ncbi:hypothetical protein LMG19089_03784 [Ralstonia edaphis]|uniref:hypothetical protein n=1 Tax=Ralstonia edaphi TaxID=3058599 RepID=UPI0028F6B393|nr:hypothetical protein [Ralstonia sp. LMG 6871]CAJ0705215.1 hypothetical protein LMG19089_03784 [Ralstonia sp. LMG 6871]